MAGRGLELVGAAALLAALGGCGIEPRETDRRGGDVRGTASTPAQPVRKLAGPVPSPSFVAAPLPKPPPAVIASPVPPLSSSYPPSDECAKLPGFAAFRATLFAAVAKRDAAGLAALADPAVNLDFGGGSGPDELRKRLTDSPALWGELAALEELGCAADGGVATLPQIFSRMPESVDAYKAQLVTGKGVALHAKPAADAKKLASLDWALVEAVGPPDPVAAWREVTTGSARGFVETAKLRSVIGYRLIADRQNGEWKVTAFVAGD